MRTWFHPAVCVETTKPGVVYCVTNVEKAAELLMGWPEHGAEWRQAIATCADALTGEKSADEAREAFLEAAKAADRFVGQIVG